MSDDYKKRINAVLVAGGQWHDIDFARLELLKLLAEDERIRTRVFEDYDSATEALETADFLVTYTCNVRCNEKTEAALKDFVESGKRWYALHGTNSILEFLAPKGVEYGKGQLDVHAPNVAPTFMKVLGSRFIAHPPIGPYQVHVTQPDHPLVEGVTPFETSDELYLLEVTGEIDVMLHAEFEGEAPGFVVKDWDKANHPVLYTHKVGKGAVLYLTLGHCRGHYDMTDFMEYYPNVDRCAWELPVFYTLLRRGLDWAKAPIFTKGS